MPPAKFELSWDWLIQVFGAEGTFLIVCFAGLSLLSWLCAPILLILLHGKVRTLNVRVDDLSEQVASLRRAQQVERLRKDRSSRRQR